MDAIKVQKIKKALNTLHLKINNVLPPDADQIIAGWTSGDVFHYTDSETRMMDGAIKTLKNIKDKYIERRLEEIWKRLLLKQ